MARQATPPAMRLLQRREFLRAAAVLAAVPNVARAAAQPLVGDCTWAVAALRRGVRVDRLPGDGCEAEAAAAAVFQAASLAKPVVATLALGLVQRGLLDLEQPLDELLPDGYVHRQNLFALRQAPVVDAVPTEMLKSLTTRHLLNHTSGLPNWADRSPLRPSFKPGARWRYSGEGYVLLQHVLQTLTGQPLHALASAALFGPLGMRHTAFKLTDDIAASRVPGRTASGNVRELRFPYEIAASSLYTTASDFAKFMAATLADPGLLTLVTEAPVPVPDAPGLHWGLGWAIEQSTQGRAIWHWGSNPGFRALAMADLETKDAVVVLTATEGGMPRAKAAVRHHLPGQHPALAFHLVQ